jgi:hypothetical protein
MKGPINVKSIYQENGLVGSTHPYPFLGDEALAQRAERVALSTPPFSDHVHSVGTLTVEPNIPAHLFEFREFA